MIQGTEQCFTGYKMQPLQQNIDKAKQWHYEEMNNSNNPIVVEHHRKALTFIMKNY